MWPPEGTEQPIRIDSIVVEPIADWRYMFDPTPDTLRESKVASLGHVSFIRKDSIPSELHQRLYHRGWRPGMSFHVFPITAYSDCSTEQRRVIHLSSCLEPNVGGDLFIVGQFVLFNRSVCLGCEWEDGIDRCRGPISEIVKVMEQRAPVTVDELVKAIPLYIWDPEE